MYIAASRNHTHVLNFLLHQKHVDVNHRTRFHGETALIVAAKKGHSEIARLLLANINIDVNQGMTDTGMSALIIASKNGHYSIVKYLLDHPHISVNNAPFFFSIGFLPMRTGCCLERLVLNSLKREDKL